MLGEMVVGATAWCAIIALAVATYNTIRNGLGEKSSLGWSLASALLFTIFFIGCRVLDRKKRCSTHSKGNTAMSWPHDYDYDD